jgi:hypothetical protein
MHSILLSNVIPKRSYDILILFFISQTPENIHYAALVIGGSILIEGVIPEHLFSLFILVI